MKRPSIYGNKTLRLAMEFSLILSEVAKDKKIEITPEIALRSQNIFINEVRTRGLQKVACDFVPLILSCFEL